MKQCWRVWDQAPTLEPAPTQEWEIAMNYNFDICKVSMIKQLAQQCATQPVLMYSNCILMDSTSTVSSRPPCSFITTWLWCRVLYLRSMLYSWEHAHAWKAEEELFVRSVVNLTMKYTISSRAIQHSVQPASVTLQRCYRNRINIDIFKPKHTASPLWASCFMIMSRI